MLIRITLFKSGEGVQGYKGGNSVLLSMRRVNNVFQIQTELENSPPR